MWKEKGGASSSSLISCAAFYLRVWASTHALWTEAGTKTRQQTDDELMDLQQKKNNWNITL